MLAVDACVSPRGDLVVAVHSGRPDWGSGPTGKGKLYKIAYTDRDAAAAGARLGRRRRSEVRVAFDRPLDPAQLQRPGARTSRSSTAEYVRAGDRFESLRPGYEVGAAADARRRGSTCRSARRAGHGRPPDADPATRPAPGGGPLRAHAARPGPAGEAARRASCRRSPAIDLGYDLSGVEATWQPDGGRRRPGPAGCRTSTWPSPARSPPAAPSTTAVGRARAAGPADAADASSTSGRCSARPCSPARRSTTPARRGGDARRSPLADRSR